MQWILARNVVEKLLSLIKRGENIDRGRIRYAIDLAREGNSELILELADDVIAFTSKGKQIKCKTLGQKRYINALKHNTVVFGVGPAGTGKTYLAVAMAVLAYKNKEVSRIILTRPAVEAGRSSDSCREICKTKLILTCDRSTMRFMIFSVRKTSAFYLSAE